MEELIADLVKGARALPPGDRLRLIDLLVDSLENEATEDIQEAWKKEIMRRIDAYEKGESMSFDAADVLAEAKAITWRQNGSLADPLSAAETAELLAAIAEADRGETISGVELFERLDRHQGD